MATEPPGLSVPHHPIVLGGPVPQGERAENPRRADGLGRGEKGAKPGKHGRVGHHLQGGKEGYLDNLVLFHVRRLQLYYNFVKQSALIGKDSKN